MGVIISHVEEEWQQRLQKLLSRQLKYHMLLTFISQD